MRKLLAAGVAAAACALTVTAVIPAAADTTANAGQVIVFSTEFQQLDTWENPTGCHKLPVAAHVLINQTGKVVRTFSDPLCLFPTLTVQPGYGAHVMPGTGSFSVTA